MEATRTRPGGAPSTNALPKNLFARSAPAKKPTGGGALASLFAREAKRLEERVVTVEPDATRPAVAAKPTTTKEKVGAGAGAPKRGSIQDLFGGAAAKRRR